MSEDLMLMCLISFIIGWIVARMMGNGFQVGGQDDDVTCEDLMPPCSYCAEYTKTKEEGLSTKSCGIIEEENCNGSGLIWCGGDDEYIEPEIFEPQFDEEAHIYHHMYMDNMRSDENWNRYLPSVNEFPLEDVLPFDDLIEPVEYIEPVEFKEPELEEEEVEESL